MNNINKKVEVLRKFMEGKKVVIIDGENEYSKLAEMLGGEVITIDPNNLSFINPFELGIEKSINNNRKNKEEVINNLKELLSIHYEWVKVTKGNKITFEDIKKILKSNNYKITDEELLNIINECKGY